MKLYWKNQNLFTLLTKFLVIILPFYVFIKVFFEHKLWIPKFGFLVKEFVLILLIISLVYEYYKHKKLPKFEYIDYLIFAYFWYGIIITLINGLWLSSIIYGWRYDFIFFLVFLIYKHGHQFLKVITKKLLSIFMYSASASLLFSILIKFRMWEEALLVFGFTDYVSNWTYQGGIPIYHGLENSGIRRFSGIFDSPNNMAFFLVLYTSLFLYLQKKKSEFYVYFFLSFLFILLILTYSRSALLGTLTATWILFIYNIKFLYKHYRKPFIIWITALILITWIFSFIFQDKVKNIVLRTSSTKGHFDRMAIWIDRFIEKPMWSWLWEAGPAYRSTHPELKNKKNTKEIEEYYIPESWFIQQLVEWGFIYFFLFISILWIILKRLFKVSHIIFWLLTAILVMNVFLHVFEATYLSILLFIFIGLFYSQQKRKLY